MPYLSSRPVSLSQTIHSNSKSPFLRKIPSYLDPKSLYKNLTQEKRSYIEFIKSLADHINIPSKKRIAVFGVGRGLESQVIAEILDRRQARGESCFADIMLQSVDISLAILKSLRRNAFSERVKSSLTQANLLNMPKNIFSNSSYALITMSSILHEIQSEKGWKGAISLFSEADRMLAPDGYLIIRDFYIPTSVKQILAFKTPLANKFFKHFRLNFNQNKGENWQKQWSLINKNTIKASSAFAFELLQHFRMFYKNYYKNLGGKVFNFFSQWQEIKESYSLRPNRSTADVSKIIKSLGKIDKSNYVCAYFFSPDSEEDHIFTSHFSCLELNSKTRRKIKSNLFPTKKLIIVLHKLPLEIKRRKDPNLGLKYFLSQLTNKTINII